MLIRFFISYLHSFKVFSRYIFLPTLTKESNNITEKQAQQAVPFGIF